jgi:predicted membrane GTPase involved in stress response
MKMGETDSADKFMVLVVVYLSVLIETMRREEITNWSTTGYYQS